MTKHASTSARTWMTYGSTAFVLALTGCSTNVDKDCDVSQHACTFLGQPGQLGFNGDGHTPTDTLMYWSMGVMFAQDSTTWFIDWNNHLVRKIGTDGKITSVVGWTDPIFPGDGDPTDPGLEKSTGGAPGSAVQLNHPTQLVQLSDGSVLICAWHDHKIRRVDPVTGNVWIVGGAGNGFKGDGGPVSAALFNRPSAFVLDEQQNIYLVDQVNLRVRWINAQTQVINTIVGNGTAGFVGAVNGDGGPGTAAQLNFQLGDNPEPEGGIAYANGTLYISDTQDNRIRTYDIATGVINAFAGTGAQGYSGDNGPASLATFYSPRGLRIGPDGNLYVADTFNSVIRKIDLATGTITTVAGTGVYGLDPQDDHLATDTMLYFPFEVDFDPAGNMYVSDSLNSRVLKVAK